MTTLEQAKAWEWLMTQVNKVQDYNMRAAMLEDLKRKALRDWGWIPGNSASRETIEVVPDLDEWEKDFYRDIKIAQNYGADIRKDKRKATLNELRANIREFIREGGDYTEIPEDIRTPEFQEMFCEEIRKYGEDAIESYKAVMGNNE